jgi:protein TonB
MALRCLLFTQDDRTAETIANALPGIGVEGEHCSEGAEALEKTAREAFQIVIIDWDLQPEAGVVLKAARERKAAERPLALAIVSDDASVPKALQAGANSILRKPILPNQLKDTLSTARDLLRARQESASAPPKPSATPAPAPPPAALPTSITGNEKTLRAGEFLQSSASAPGGQFITETDIPDSPDQSLAGPVDPLQELEPMAAAMEQRVPKEESPAQNLPNQNLPTQNLPGEPRGLEWYLKKSGIARPGAPVHSGTAAAAAPAPAPAKVELLGYEQTVSSLPSTTAAPTSPAGIAAGNGVPAQSESAPLHAPIDHPARDLVRYPAVEESATEDTARPGFRLGKGAIATAVVLAGFAIAMAPQAPWHARVMALSARGQRAAHAWLNPQPVAPAAAPTTHENFGQAGDEYKLPVAENIPDATTDPSQIRVTPVIDPTAKQPNNGNNAAAAGQTPAPDDTDTSPDDAAPNSGSVQENPAPGATTPNAAPGGSPPSPAPVAESPKTTPPAAVPASVSAVPRPIPPPIQTHVSAPPSSNSSNVSIPSSLKSQMASMTPDASGNKPVEAAMPTIEPVTVPESTERGLLADQPAIAYPASGKGQQGTVVLQVLIGRDGTVQDAKFLQGSLMFARAAIEGVKQWKFKPYLMNGRAVSVQTSMTVGFKP